MPKNTLLILAAGFALAAPAVGQWTGQRDPAVGGSPEIPLTEGRFNAALQYHTAWMLLEPVLDFNDFTSDELDALDEGILPERYAELLEENQNYIEMLIDASRLEECDFGLNYEQGIETLIPQLAVMRSSAKLLVNDARRLRNSDTDAVAERLAATIWIGEHASQTRTVIGSLVGIAIAELARSETIKLLDENKLSSEQAKLIDGALDRVLVEDPFFSLGSVRTEAVMMTTWIRHEFNDETAGEQFVDVFVIAGAEGHEDKLERELQGMDGKAIGKMTEKAAVGYEDLIEAWQAEDPKAAMDRVEQKLIQGGYGPVAQLVMPALGNFRERVSESERNLAELRERLNAVGD
ncbi:MAG: hypothetical protein ED559_11680 [Phycisphaera sp.]|nr:MAG: hypothetical protein ED559_11680 [Phycisphaera sp.]